MELGELTIRLELDETPFIHHLFRSLARIESRQQRILRKLGDIEAGDNQEFNIIMQEVDDLIREVSETKGATQSLVTLTQGLSERLTVQADAVKTLDEAKAAMRAAANDLDTNEQAIAEAVKSNPLPDDFKPSGNA